MLSAVAALNGSKGSGPFPSANVVCSIQYNQLVIALMKLVLAFDPAENPAVSDLCAGKTPQLVFDEANLVLETVMRLYYMRHSFEFFDPWLAFASIIIGNTAIANIAAGSSNESNILGSYRSALIMSAQCLNSQGLNFHLGTLLAIQLQSVMGSREMELVRTYVTAAGINNHDQELIAYHSHSQWPVPIIAINENPEKVILKNLVKAFEEVEIQSSDVSSQEGTPPPR